MDLINDLQPATEFVGAADYRGRTGDRTRRGLAGPSSLDGADPTMLSVSAGLPWVLSRSVPVRVSRGTGSDCYLARE